MLWRAADTVCVVRRGHVGRVAHHQIEKVTTALMLSELAQVRSAGAYGNPRPSCVEARVEHCAQRKIYRSNMSGARPGGLDRQGSASGADVQRAESWLQVERADGVGEQRGVLLRWIDPRETHERSASPDSTEPANGRCIHGISFTPMIDAQTRGDRAPSGYPCRMSQNQQPSGRARRVRVVPGGPILIEGPVEVEDDGQWVKCDRFVVALCGCRRSGTMPLCDSSHRRAVAGLRRR